MYNENNNVFVDLIIEWATLQWLIHYVDFVW